MKYYMTLKYQLFHTGTVYVRWGHDDCPIDAETVYSGASFVSQLYVYTFFFFLAKVLSPTHTHTKIWFYCEKLVLKQSFFVCNHMRINILPYDSLLFFKLKDTSGDRGTMMQGQHRITCVCHLSLLSATIRFSLRGMRRYLERSMKVVSSRSVTLLLPALCVVFRGPLL